MGRLLPREHPGEALHPAPHGLESAALHQFRRRRHPRRDPRGDVVVGRESAGIELVRLDAVPRELPRPDPGPDARRRLAELDREHHAPEHRLTGLFGAVRGPEGGDRSVLEEPVHEHLGAVGPEPGAARAHELHPPERGRVREQVLHLVEEEYRTGAAREEALGEAKLLESLPARWLVTFFVRFPNDVESHPEPSGKGPAELRLPGPGLPVHEHVDSLGSGAKRSPDEAFHVVPGVGNVVKVRPLELAGRRGVEQQLVGAELAVSGNRRQSVQPVDDRDIAVLVDGNQPRFHKRCVRLEARKEGPPGDAEKAGKRGGASHVEDLREPPIVPSSLEDGVDQRLDDRMRAVPEQDLEDREVRPREPHLASEAPQPHRQPVRPDSPGIGTISFEQVVPQLVPLALGKPALRLPAPWTLPAEFNGRRSRKAQQTRILRDPVRELSRLLDCPDAQARDGVREIAEDEVSFVGGEHCRLHVRDGSDEG